MSNPTNMTVTAATVGAPESKHRIYLAVFAGATDVTVTLEGQTPFVVASGTTWEPRTPPMNAVTCTGTGTIITG
jgi:hypothetical protein